MDERERDVDERGPGEEAVNDADGRSEPPAVALDRDEDHAGGPERFASTLRS
jgi:hypothetical protein